MIYFQRNYLIDGLNADEIFYIRRVDPSLWPYEYELRASDDRCIALAHDENELKVLCDLYNLKLEA